MSNIIEQNNNRGIKITRSFDHKQTAVSNERIEIRREGRTISGERKEKFFKIPFRCSKTKKEIMFYLKKGINGLYKIDRIFTEDKFSKLDYMNRFPEKNKEEVFEENEIDASEIDWEKIKCPYCGGKGIYPIIKCGQCEKFGCDGGLKEEKNKHLYKCPWCGIENYVTEKSLQTVKGEEVKEKNLEKKEKLNEIETKGMLNSEKQYLKKIT